MTLINGLRWKLEKKILIKLTLSILIHSEFTNKISKLDPMRQKLRIELAKLYVSLCFSTKSRLQITWTIIFNWASKTIFEYFYDFLFISHLCPFYVLIKKLHWVGRTPISPQQTFLFFFLYWLISLDSIIQSFGIGIWCRDSHDVDGTFLLIELIIRRLVK